MKISEKKLNLNQSIKSKDSECNSEKKSDKILCLHCNRTASNGIRCLGICVADNEY